MTRRSPAEILELKRAVWRSLAYQRFGVCCDCRTAPRDAEGRPREVRGHDRKHLRCKPCFMDRPLGRIPKAVTA